MSIFDEPNAKKKKVEPWYNLVEVPPSKDGVLDKSEGEENSDEVEEET